jgi:Trypsin-co-occurring domain 2
MIAKSKLRLSREAIMLTCRQFLVVAVAVFMLIGASKPIFAADSPDVEQLLKQLRSTLIKVQGEIATQRLPELKSVQIDLQTGIKTTGGGKITFFVVSIGDTITRERVQSFKITLTPPKVTSTQVAATQDFSRDFANAIIAVAETIARSSGQKPELKLTSLSASIKFVSNSTIEGGVTKVQLLPVSIDLGGSVTPTNTHEAVLNFGSSDGSSK